MYGLTGTTLARQALRRQADFGKNGLIFALISGLLLPSPLAPLPVSGEENRMLPLRGGKRIGIRSGIGQRSASPQHRRYIAEAKVL